MPEEIVPVNGVDVKDQGFSNNDWTDPVTPASDIITEAIETVIPEESKLEEPKVDAPIVPEEVIPPVEGEVKTEEVVKEEGEKVKVELSPEDEKIVEKIEEKKEEGKNLLDREIIVDRTLTDLTVSKQQVQELEIEKKVLTEALEKQKVEVAQMKANPNYMEVSDDLMQIVERHKLYGVDRSDDNAYDKLIRSIYWLLDKLGGPDVEQSFNTHQEYKKRQVMAIGGQVVKANDSLPDPKPADKVPTAHGVPWRAAFTNRK